MNPFFSSTQSALKTNNVDTSEAAFVKILELEKQCLEQVITLLKTEHETILQQDTQAMGTLMDKKLPLLSQLEQLDKQRQNFFQQKTGLQHSIQGFTRFIEQNPSETIQNLWLTIKEKLPECKKYNELNGRIINIRKNNCDQILQILLGRPVNTPQTYSHLGQTSQQKRSALYTAV